MVSIPSPVGIGRLICLSAECFQHWSGISQPGKAPHCLSCQAVSSLNIFLSHVKCASHFGSTVIYTKFIRICWTFYLATVPFQMWNENNKREYTFICHIIGPSLTTSLLKGPGSLCSLPALSDMGQRYTPWNEQFAPENKQCPKREQSCSKFQPSIFRWELLVLGRVLPRIRKSTSKPRK